MVFNSVHFLIFFIVVSAGVMRLPTGNARKFGLLLASWYFYSIWSWWFSGLLVLTAIVHWGAARINRRWSMWTAVGCSVGILAAFKYLGLWIDSIIMPVGISFYTFQAISYTVDVYKGKIKARDSFVDVALYIGFFPQLLSGPIVRAADFFQQLGERTCRLAAARYDYAALADGLGRFTFGFFKKVFIADRMSVYVGRVFENCNLFDGYTLWVAAIAYTIQIYCDFSGYSDMAIGVARALGFDYGKNFDHPYLSTSVTEFWRRWHISLSTWLRDYIYIPLGGNRKGLLRQYSNQMVTMLIGGIWHGADWTFVAWGGLHGCALCVHKWWMKASPCASVAACGFYRVLAWLLTMLTVVFGWILFRANTFNEAWIFVTRMVSFADGISWIHPHVFAAVFLLVLGSVRFNGKYASEVHDVRTPLGFFVTGVLFLLSVLFPAGAASPFIYFQF